jgi:peptidoglycan/xylan/chitin deacetylase (PgdA/CDA1 family)
VRQFDIDEPVMVLTFDAGADRGFAEEILDILAEEGIAASFGMTGPWAEDNLDLLARIVDEGHHLINHSWSHPHFPELTSEERIAEVERLESLVRDEVGVELQPYFRPPFGEYDEATLVDLSSIGYTVNVMWTVDTLGWNGLTADEINTRVLDTAAPGGIVLMHVGAQSQDAAALPEMIRLLREQGYSFATIEDLAGL